MISFPEAALSLLLFIFFFISLSAQRWLTVSAVAGLCPPGVGKQRQAFPQKHSQFVLCSLHKEMCYMGANE